MLLNAWRFVFFRAILIEEFDSLNESTFNLNVPRNKSNVNQHECVHWAHLVVGKQLYLVETDSQDAKVQF